MQWQQYFTDSNSNIYSDSDSKILHTAINRFGLLRLRYIQ